MVACFMAPKLHSMDDTNVVPAADETAAPVAAPEEVTETEEVAAPEAEAPAAEEAAA